MAKDKTAKAAPKLSIKQRKFLKNLAEGCTQKDAAIKAGYSKRSAKAIATENLTKPSLRTPFLQMLESKGINDARLADSIAAGLDATKVISCNVIAAEGMADANGMTKDFVDVPDFMARHKFVDTCLKLRGDYPIEKDPDRPIVIRIFNKLNPKDSDDGE
jgi:hypothetical protein